MQHVERLAGEAAARGAKPDVIWHSGKLRARQTAEAFWRACNPLASFSATKDLQPDDPAAWIRDRLRGETRDVLLAGHMPHFTRLLQLLAPARHDDIFPLHGMVALESRDDGETWDLLWQVG